MIAKGKALVPQLATLLYPLEQVEGWDIVSIAFCNDLTSAPYPVAVIIWLRSHISQALGHPGWDVDWW